eukprot:6480410-Amphidinium_carterae.2
MSDLPIALVSFWSSERQQPLFWQSLALPFGALASVYGFNEACRGIEIIMNMVGPVVCSSYFDDFPLVDFECCAESSTAFAESCLKLLGWKFDTEGHKYKPYTRSLEVLGVLVKLDQYSIEARNTAARVQQIVAELTGLLDKRTWTKADASRLAGRLNFFRTYVAGK